MKFRVKCYVMIVFWSSTMFFPRIIDATYFSEFQKFKNYYQWLTFDEYTTVEYASKYFSVPVDKILAIIKSESNGNPRAISCVGARGLMQVMPIPEHYKGPADDLYNVHLNIYCGTRYLKWCLQFTDNDFPRAIMAYNAGPYMKPQNYPKALRENYLNKIVFNSIKTASLPRKHIEVE